MNSLTIKPSKIHGKGVFTKKTFKKDETVINWEPCIIKLTNEEIIQLPETEKQFVKNNILLQSPSRFLNHSCNPNLTIKNHNYIAKEEIQPEEELTINYNKEDIILLIPMKCNCNQSNCKKTIIKLFQQ
ncbi:MAG: SET domain-containing protein-lysine N-methyltransferase [Candidatus Woesearchaeota archaeon]